MFFDARIEGSPLQIRLLLLETGQQKIVVNDGANANYAPTGHLVYHQSRTSLVAAPFDLTRLEVTGDSVSVLEEVLGVGYTFSNDGTLIYIPSVTLSEPPEDTLIWVDRKGMQQEVIDKKFIGRVRQLSPDRRRIATVQREDGESHIWIYDLEDGLFRRLTFEGEVNDGPAWTPDGKWIAFRSNRDGPFNLYRKLADGSRPVERLTTSEFSQSPASWSPDGSVLVFRQRSTNGKNMSIWVLPMKGGRKPRAFITPSDPVWNLNFSPDGRWLAYLTNSSKAGRTNGVHLYVRPYPGPDVKWLISGEDAGGPVWSPDGTELFYRSVPHHPLRPQDLTKIMGVSIQTQPSFRAGKPRLLFEGLYEGIMGLSPDGHRFLMSKRSTRESPRQGINVVLNWFEELKRKVPTDN